MIEDLYIKTIYYMKDAVQDEIDKELCKSNKNIEKIALGRVLIEFSERFLRVFSSEDASDEELDLLLIEAKAIEKQRKVFFKET